VVVLSTLNGRALKIFIITNRTSAKQLS